MAGTPIVNPQQRALQLAQVREQFKNDPGILRKLVMGLTKIPHKAWETGEMPTTPEAMRYSLNTLGGLYGTGGAARMAGIGGLTGEGAGMALPMGRQAKGPWKVGKESYQGPGGTVAKHETPSGLEVKFDAHRNDPSGWLSTNVSFAEKNPNNPYDRWSGKPASSMREGLERLNDVFAAVDHYVTKIKPKVLTFEAGSGGLRQLYDRAAEQMAKRYGAHLTKPYRGEYQIEFPEAKTYATPKPKPYIPPPRRRPFAELPEGTSLSAHMASWAEGYGIPKEMAWDAIYRARHEFGTKVNLDQIKQGLIDQYWRPRQAATDLGPFVAPEVPEGFGQF